MNDFVKALESRRSQYALNAESNLSNAEITDMVNRVTVATPSAFNSQTQRVVLLFGEENQKLWGIVKDALHKVAASEEAFAKTSAKIDSFAAGRGTLLFFDDVDGTNKLAEQFPSYAESFPTYAEQSLGMLELSVWAALSEAGLGASLQHYNPLIDDAVRDAFTLPASWKLGAQMPFGGIVEGAEAQMPERVDVAERVKVRGL